MKTVPDQEKSQEVDIGSIAAQKGEWVAWTRSYYIASNEVPSGISLESGTVQYLKMAVSCLVDSVSARILEVRLVNPNGKVAYESKQEMDTIYSRVDGLEYGQSAPGLICAAALAKQKGKSLPWPMRKSEHRDFVRDLM